MYTHCHCWDLSQGCKCSLEQVALDLALPLYHDHITTYGMGFKQTQQFRSQRSQLKLRTEMCCFFSSMKLLVRLRVALDCKMSQRNNFMAHSKLVSVPSLSFLLVTHNTSSGICSLSWIPLDSMHPLSTLWRIEAYYPNLPPGKLHFPVISQ